jgi:biopolymer transport protein ExbB
MAGGIYEALLTTAAGLIVGIVAYIGYNHLSSEVQKIVHSMEYNSIEFMDLLQEPNQ